MDEILPSWQRYTHGRWVGSPHLQLSGGFKLSCKVKHQQEKLSCALLAPFAPDCHLMCSGQSSKGHKVQGQTPLHGERENIRSPAPQINDVTAEPLDKGAHLLLKHPRKWVLHFLRASKEKCFIWSRWNIDVQHPAILLVYLVAGKLKTQCGLNTFLYFFCSVIRLGEKCLPTHLKSK